MQEIVILFDISSKKIIFEDKIDKTIFNVFESYSITFLEDECKTLFCLDELCSLFDNHFNLIAKFNQVLGYSFLPEITSIFMQ